GRLENRIVKRGVVTMNEHHRAPGRIVFLQRLNKAIPVQGADLLQDEMLFFVLLGPERNAKYREIGGSFDFTDLVSIWHAHESRAEVQLLVAARRDAYERNWRRPVISDQSVRRIKHLDVLARIRRRGAFLPAALIAVPAPRNSRPVV